MNTNETKYTYYAKMQDTEHYLNCIELAHMYHIYSNKGKPHIRFVAALLSEYYRNNPDITKYYYNGSKGLYQVYPQSIWKPILSKLMQDYEWGVEQSYITDKGKKHNFILDFENVTE